MGTTQRVRLRIDPDTLARIEGAASVVGSSMAEFVRDAAAARADDVLDGWSETRVPPAFFDELIAALDAPYGDERTACPKSSR